MEKAARTCKSYALKNSVAHKSRPMICRLRYRSLCNLRARTAEQTCCTATGHTATGNPDSA
eukprot:5553564-Pleurochrysis_carterae.AAC.1